MHNWIGLRHLRWLSRIFTELLSSELFHHSNGQFVKRSSSMLRRLLWVTASSGVAGSDTCFAHASRAHSTAHGLLTRREGWGCSARAVDTPVGGIVGRGARGAGNAVQRERFRREAAVPAAQRVLPRGPPPLPAQLLCRRVLRIAFGFVLTFHGDHLGAYELLATHATGRLKLSVQMATAVLTAVPCLT